MYQTNCSVYSSMPSRKKKQARDDICAIERPCPLDDIVRLDISFHMQTVSISGPMRKEKLIWWYGIIVCGEMTGSRGLLGVWSIEVFFPGGGSISSSHFAHIMREPCQHYRGLACWISKRPDYVQKKISLLLDLHYANQQSFTVSCFPTMSHCKRHWSRTLMLW